MSKKRRVVVTGTGIVSCFGSDVDRFYQCLLEGKSGVGPITQFDCSDYPTRFAASVNLSDVNIEDYLDKKQARRVDPFITYAVIAAKKALKAAGLEGEILNQIDKTRTGVLVGSGMGGMSAFYEGSLTIKEKGFRRLTPFFIPYIITNMAGALIAIDFGFMGPNYSTSTACATSNYMLIQGAQHIRSGEADIMVCGGSEAPINPVGVAGFVAIKALSERNDSPQTASRPWDKERDGFVMGEGSGVLILEEYEHAKRRGAPILAELLGGGLSCDAYHITEPHPEGAGLLIAFEKTLKDADIPKERVNHINAHATSTPVGDMAEIHGIKKFFGDQTKNIKINSTKSMTGHCLGAASAIEAIATIKALETGMIHQTANLVHPEEGLYPLDPVMDKPLKFEIDVAFNNSFGFGGHNSCVAFSRVR